MKYVPEFLKGRLRPLPQWVAIGTDASSMTQVVLDVAGKEFDVTTHHVIAALRPLTVALRVDLPIEDALQPDRRATLRFFDRSTCIDIGSLILVCKGSVGGENSGILLFEIQGSSERCVNGPYGLWNRWLQGRNAGKPSKNDPFAMSSKTLRQIMMFYACPRPVVLVSVDDGTHRNLFPMDLIGPLGDDLFTLALRSTSRSVETMKTTGKVAVSNIAADEVSIAYKLGNQHKNALLDWNTLPFAFKPSKEFLLPVPDNALRVREFEITNHAAIGSHTFFICRKVTDTAGRIAPLLCHTSGLYEYFRKRNNLALQRAS